jgi:hypothetical protein
MQRVDVGFILEPPVQKESRVRVAGDFREHRLFGEHRENRRRFGSRRTRGERIE